MLPCKRIESTLSSRLSDKKNGEAGEGEQVEEREEMKTRGDGERYRKKTEGWYIIYLISNITGCWSDFFTLYYMIYLILN